MPSHENGHPIEKPSTRRCRETEKHIGRERRRHKGDEGPQDRRTPQGPTRTWVQAEGGKGGGTDVGNGGRRRHMAGVGDV